MFRWKGTNHPIDAARRRSQVQISTISSQLAPASKGLLPIAGSPSFPELVCRVEDGTQIAIQDVLKQRAVTLACVAFRQNAQVSLDEISAQVCGRKRSSMFETTPCA